ncbi:MAG: PilZ domain-containing protein [Pseudomonadota bacterium]
MNEKPEVKKRAAPPALAGGGGAILHLTITDKAALHTVYMPFVRGGGFFVPTPRPFQMGDEVFVLVSLWDDAQPTPVLGNVVWITPMGVQGKRAAGIGVRFKQQEGEALRARVETLLAGLAKSDRITHTM